MEKYHVPQELKSQTKLTSAVPIYVKDVFIISFILGIAYIFRNLVADELTTVYWITAVCTAVILALPSFFNRKRRMYESLFLYLSRDSAVYSSAVKESDSTAEKEKSGRRIRKNRLSIQYNQDYQCFEMDDGANHWYANLMEILTKDIINAAPDEIDYDIAKITKFNKLEYEPYKIIAMNFPCSTNGQQGYVQRKISRTNNVHFQEFLQDSLKELEWIQKQKTKREFYLMYFSDSLDGIKKLDADMKIAVNKSEILFEDMTFEKKLQVFYRINNPSTIMQGGTEEA